MQESRGLEFFWLFHRHGREDTGLCQAGIRSKETDVLYDYHIYISFASGSSSLLARFPKLVVEVSRCSYDVRREELTSTQVKPMGFVFVVETSRWRVRELMVSALLKSLTFELEIFGSSSILTPFGLPLYWTQRSPCEYLRELLGDTS